MVYDFNMQFHSSLRAGLGVEALGVVKLHSLVADGVASPPCKSQCEFPSTLEIRKMINYLGVCIQYTRITLWRIHRVPGFRILHLNVADYVGKVLTDFSESEPHISGVAMSQKR